MRSTSFAHGHWLTATIFIASRWRIGENSRTGFSCRSDSGWLVDRPLVVSPGRRPEHDVVGGPLDTAGCAHLDGSFLGTVAGEVEPRRTWQSQSLPRQDSVHALDSNGAHQRLRTHPVGSGHAGVAVSSRVAMILPVILATSSIAGYGDSTVAINLARQDAVAPDRRAAFSSRLGPYSPGAEPPANRHMSVNCPL